MEGREGEYKDEKERGRARVEGMRVRRASIFFGPECADLILGFYLPFSNSSSLSKSLLDQNQAR